MKTSTQFLFVKRAASSALTVATASILMAGCTSVALRDNSLRQARTVREVLASQVLYNLSIYHDYYNSKDCNGLPTFVKLLTGGASVQQSLSAQVGLKITAPSTEKDPQLTGSHQTTDNWSVSPVVNPSEIKRLHNLYRTLFEAVPQAEVEKLFPPQPVALDQQGRPFLDYASVTNRDGSVLINSNNQPQFTARVKPMVQLHKWQIPGAIWGKEKWPENLPSSVMANKNPWFCITTLQQKVAGSDAGRYGKNRIWITNADGFYQFVLLTLGDDNPNEGGPLTKPSMLSEPMIIQSNGVLLNR
jgi:hypothetical protein